MQVINFYTHLNFCNYFVFYTSLIFLYFFSCIWNLATSFPSKNSSKTLIPYNIFHSLSSTATTILYLLLFPSNNQNFCIIHIFSPPLTLRSRSPPLFCLCSSSLHKIRPLFLYLSFTLPSLPSLLAYQVLL